MSHRGIGGTGRQEVASFRTQFRFLYDGTRTRLALQGTIGSVQNYCYQSLLLSRSNDLAGHMVIC